MSKRILVIDDEESIHDDFAAALDGLGHDVAMATHGEEGISMARDKKFDLIFLDLRMPGKNGVETLRTLRQKDQHVPIYIMSAYAREYIQDLIRADRSFVDFQYALKPIAAEDIRRIVKETLG